MRVMKTRMEKIVPLAASTVTGPLAVAHLPRLWLKALLNAAGLLPEDYASSYAGSDRDAIDGIGLDPDATFTYLATLPSYRQFEAWVRANAAQLDPASIATVNAAITGRLRAPEKAATSRAALGLGDSGERRTALLNALDDWATVHAAVLARDARPLGHIVPAISSQSAGPLGLLHLPRLWLKALLSAAGALYPGWVSGQASGFDRAFAAEVGCDLDAVIAHVHATLPSYPQFEAWFSARHPELDAERIARHNVAIRGRQKPEEIAARERAELGIDDPNYRPSVDINDQIDWLTLHGICVAATAGQRSLA